MGQPERLFSDQLVNSVVDFMDKNDIPPFRTATPREFDNLVRLVGIIADVQELKKSLDNSVLAEEAKTAQ